MASSRNGNPTRPAVREAGAHFESGTQALAPSNRSHRFFLFFFFLLTSVCRPPPPPSLFPPSHPPHLPRPLTQNTRIPTHHPHLSLTRTIKNTRRRLCLGPPPRPSGRRVGCGAGARLLGARPCLGWGERRRGGRGCSWFRGHRHRCQRRSVDDGSGLFRGAARLRGSVPGHRLLRLPAGARRRSGQVRGLLLAGLGPRRRCPRGATGRQSPRSSYAE